MRLFRLGSPIVAVNALVAFSASAAWAATVPVRVAAYNIDADTGSTTVNDANLTTVLGGIGNANPDGAVRPADILALEETTSNAVTVQPIVNDLNTLYRTTAYAVPSLQPGESGNYPGTGNGPSSIVYNSATLELLGATTIGPANGSSNGVYRQVARYEFQPAAAAGGTAAGAFYVYVEHAKSGSTSADVTARGQEAALVRADADALPANSRVTYVGDFNIGASTEQSFTNYEAAGPGQAFDPINMPGNYALSKTFNGILTESAANLRYRDDLQLITGNVKNDATGLEYTPGSYTAFGNNGPVPEAGSVASAGNTALPGLANRTAVLTALTQVTDHLPVVADYADVVGPTVANWKLPTGGTWGAVANWTTTTVPTGAGAAVTFGPALTATAGTVTLDGNRTVGRVTFANANAYTIAPGTGGTLTINDAGGLNGGALPTIAVTGGSHTIAAPLSLAAGLSINLSAGTGLTLNGPVTGTGTLIVAKLGLLTVGPAAAIGVPVRAFSNVTFAPNPNAAPLVRSITGLTIAAGTQVTVAAGTAGRSVLVPGSLTLAGSPGAWTGRLDLTGNDLDAPAADLATVASQVAAGYANGLWTGPGIASSTAAADPTHLTALGVALNTAAGGSTLYPTFDGRTAAATDVLVRYTYYGDANLDGVVDAADYARIDAGFLTGGTGWANGDFNYDGVVDGSDYTLIDNAFNQQAGPLASPSAGATALVATSTAEIAAVPEPAAAGALLVGVAVVGLRRRCRDPRRTG